VSILKKYAVEATWAGGWAGKETYWTRPPCQLKVWKPYDRANNTGKKAQRQNLNYDNVGETSFFKSTMLHEKIAWEIHLKNCGMKPRLHDTFLLGYSEYTTRVLSMKQRYRHTFGSKPSFGRIRASIRMHANLQSKCSAAALPLEEGPVDKVLKCMQSRSKKNDLTSSLLGRSCVKTRESPTCQSRKLKTRNSELK